MEQRRLGRTGLEGLGDLSGDDDVRGAGRRGGVDEDPRRRDGPGRDVHRHGRCLPDPARARDGGLHRGGHRPLAGARAGPARRAHPGDQVPDPGRPRAQRPGAVAQAHPCLVREELTPAGDRLHRPLPGPHARPRDAHRRDLAGVRGPRPLGKGAVCRLLELSGLAARPGVGGERAKRLGAVRLRPAAGTTSSTGRSRTSSCPSAATRGSA